MFGFFRRAAPAEVFDSSSPPYGGRLSLMVVLVALSSAALWCFGIRQQQILDAVEQGAAVIEERTIGDVEQDEIRESIQTQRQSIPFWSTLAILGDLVIEPMAPVFRALVLTIAFSSFAALFGRPVAYGVALADNVTWQWFWVAGVVLDSMLKIVVSPAAANSLLVFLPAKEYPANTVITLAAVNPLAICGWLVVAWAAWKRKQVNWFLALFIVLVLALTEASIRGSLLATMGALVRLTIVQQ
jgi:hypothetical protein